MASVNLTPNNISWLDDNPSESNMAESVCKINYMISYSF